MTTPRVKLTGEEPNTMNWLSGWRKVIHFRVLPSTKCYQIGPLDPLSWSFRYFHICVTDQVAGDKFRIFGMRNNILNSKNVVKLRKGLGGCFRYVHNIFSSQAECFKS